ncbi:MAG TPA: hypothetical protein VF576_05135 [Rubricoccaceae bacterium]
MATSNAATRSLLEVTLGFLGAILIVPFAFTLVKVAFGTVTTVVGGLFRMRTTRRLLGDLAVAGVTALLTRNDVLDAVFGRRDDDAGRLDGPRR